MLKNLDAITTYRVKSQLAGFFAFILLSACQPVIQPESELMQQAKTDAAAATRLAGMRLDNAEHDAALQWLRQAALLGDSQALAHALHLQHLRFLKPTLHRCLRKTLVVSCGLSWNGSCIALPRHSHLAVAHDSALLPPRTIRSAIDMPVSVLSFS